MIVFSFVDQIIKKRKELRGRDWLGTIDEGIEHFPEIDKFIQGTRHDEVIMFDITGLKLFGYSYSKQTIRRALQAAIAGYYDDRMLLIHAPNVKSCKELEKGLQEESLIMIASSSTGRDYYKDYFLLGSVTPQAKEAIDIVIKAAKISTNEVAKKVGVSLQVASNRLKELVDLRLVMRNKPVDRAGNVYEYERIKAL